MTSIPVCPVPTHIIPALPSATVITSPESLTNMSKIQLSFCASNLTNPSLFGSIDAMLVISQQEHANSSTYTTIYISDIILNSNSPQFRRSLTTYHYPQHSMRFRCQIFDVKSPNLLNFHEHVLMGQLHFNLTSLVNSLSQSFTGKLLKSDNTLCKHGTLTVYSTILQHNFASTLQQQTRPQSHLRTQSHELDLSVHSISSNTHRFHEIEKQTQFSPQQPLLTPSISGSSIHQNRTSLEYQTLYGPDTSDRQSQSTTSNVHTRSTMTHNFPEMTIVSNTRQRGFSQQHHKTPYAVDVSQSAQYDTFNASTKYSPSSTSHMVPPQEPTDPFHNSIESSVFAAEPDQLPLQSSQSNLSAASCATNLTTTIPLPIIIKRRPSFSTQISHTSSQPHQQQEQHQQPYPYPKKILCKIDLQIKKTNKNIFFQILTNDAQSIVYQSSIISYQQLASFLPFQLDIERLIKPTYGLYYDAYQKDQRELPASTAPTIFSTTAASTATSTTTPLPLAPTVSFATPNAPTITPIQPRSRPTISQTFLDTFRRTSVSNLDQTSSVSSQQQQQPPVATIRHPPPPQNNNNFIIRIVKFKSRNLDDPRTHSKIILPISTLFEQINVPPQSAMYQATPSQIQSTFTPAQASLTTARRRSVSNSAALSSTSAEVVSPGLSTSPTQQTSIPIILPLFSKSKTKAKGTLSISLVDPSYCFSLQDFVETKSLDLSFSVGVDFSTSKRGYDSIDSSHYCRPLPVPQGVVHGGAADTTIEPQLISHLPSITSSTSRPSSTQHDNDETNNKNNDDNDDEFDVTHMDWSQNAVVTAINNVISPLMAMLGKDVNSTNIQTYGFAGRYDNGEVIEEPITTAFPLSLFNDTLQAGGIEQLIEQYKEARLSLENPQLYHCFSAFLNTLTHDLHQLQTRIHSYHNYNPNLLYNSVLPPSGTAQTAQTSPTSPTSPTPQPLQQQSRHRRSSSVTLSPPSVSNTLTLTQNQIDQFNDPNFKPTSIPPPYHISFILTDQPNSFSNAKSILQVLFRTQKLPFCVIIICLKTFSIQAFNSTFDYLNSNISPYPLWNIENFASTRTENVNTGPKSSTTNYQTQNYRITTSKFDTISPLEFLSPNPISIFKCRYYQNNIAELWELINTHAMTFLSSNLLYPCNYTYNKPISGNSFPFSNSLLSKAENFLLSAQKQAQIALDYQNGSGLYHQDRPPVSHESGVALERIVSAVLGEDASFVKLPQLPNL